PPPPPPPPPPTGISAQGVITGFGSVWINGVKYEVENGTIVSVEDEDDVTGDDSKLRIGMNVSVQGEEASDGTRTAGQITYDDDVKGPVDSVTPDANDPTIGTFTVVGQTIIVDANTVFDNNIGNNDGQPGIDIRDLDPANFAAGNPIIVEVSGYPTDSGFLATRVEKDDLTFADIGNPAVDGDEIEVKGFVDAVAADGSTVTINAGTFNITASTTIDDGLVIDSSLVGVFVEVKLDKAGTVPETYNVVKIEREDGFGNNTDNDEFEIEGVLTSVDTFSTPNVIVIAGQTIEVVDASGLSGRVGQRLEIKGSFNGDGVLVLALVKVEVENSVRTEDIVNSVTNGVITTRLGLEVTPTGASRVEDDTSDDGDGLTVDEFLARVSSGDFIEARGFPETDGSVTWTRVEKDDLNSERCRLRGPVEEGSIADPVFVIQGVEIDTTNLGFGGFEDENNVDIGRSAFFARLAAGDVVQATSDDAGAGCSTGLLETLASGEVEFEPEDGVQGNGGDDGDPNSPTGGQDEVSGAISALDADAETFVVAGITITVTDETLFDASIVEAATGQNLPDADVPRSDINLSLDLILANGDLVKVELNGDATAIRIEDDKP
ncbi:MAG: DUF5666 domain-containing protein, partial [Henriciella sp.]